MTDQQPSTAPPPATPPTPGWIGAATTPERFAATEEARHIDAQMIQLRQSIQAAAARASELAKLVAGPTTMLEKAAAYDELASLCRLSDDIARQRDKAMERLRELKKEFK